MLKYLLYLIFVFSLFGIVYIMSKIYRINADKKLLDSISDNIKDELIKTPSYLLMDEENKKEFKKLNIKDVSGFLTFWLIIAVAVFLLFFITSIVITGKGDTSLFSFLLWISMPAVLIFLYFAGKDALRVSKSRKIYEIRAFCADIRTASTHYGGCSKTVSLVYYDYKKMKYCITSIPVSAGHDELGYCVSFCWAMAVEKEKSIKVIDISPQAYET